MNETLHIPAEKETPEVLYDPADSSLRFIGNSYPVNADHFYTPVINWIEEHLMRNHAAMHLVVHVQMNYINTTSAKYIGRLISMLNKYYTREKSFVVYWYYFDSDDDMESLGEELLRSLQIPYELIFVQHNDE